jgi:hypothetical protein
LLAGALQATSAWLLAGSAVTCCGAPGAVAPIGVTALDGEDAGPDPAEFAAATVNV